jgi:hypothetical protein
MGTLAGNGLPYFIFEATSREVFSHSLGQNPTFDAPVQFASSLIHIVYSTSL